MAEGDDKNSKTEDPTSKRLSDARDKGQTAKSQEVNTFIIIMAALIYFTFFGMRMIRGLIELWGILFAESFFYELTQSSLVYLFAATMREVAIIVMPILLFIALAGVISNYLQNDGWIFSFDPLGFKFNKINPLSGVKKIIGREGVMNLGKSLMKIIVIGGAAYLALSDEWEKMPLLMQLPVAQSLQMIGNEIFWLFLKVLFAMMVIALIDLVYQRWSFKDNMKMTKQEVKDEQKQQEGDPLVKGRIKQKQFDQFRNRMMAAVPEAEVIITNPTHLSIAIRYDRLNDAAPVVVAKGAGFIALRIREIAKENDITILENKPLAQTLFKSVDIGEAVPESLYKSIADILAYVYRIKKKVV